MDPRSFVNTRRPRARALLAAVALSLALPTQSLGSAGYNTSSPPYVMTSGVIAGVTFVPLVNSGEEVFGDLFEGIPDGIGVVPGARDDDDRRNGDDDGWVDLYVAHEQSRVPFAGKADFSDSSVTRVRVDTETMSVIDMEVALPSSAGFIRFCSAFMAGPRQGFKRYTFLLNEESNDPLEVPAGAVYPADPAYAPNPWRQAGYSVYLDTKSGSYDVIPGAGRHNHENQVIVPGWRQGIVSLSGDDSFIFPSTPERPNLSQLYMFTSRNWRAFERDNGKLWAFRVTGTGGAPIDPTDPFNDANDYLEIGVGDDWSGEFIKVPGDIARGTTAALPHDGLEDWSNANNVFQFVRVEDIAYDPDHPRTVYFADTGTSRLEEDATTGRLVRLAAGGVTSNGRIFKMVFNKWDPRKVDSFSILTDADVEGIGMRAPDNLDVGRRSIMVQEDASDAKIWMYSLRDDAWTHVATGVQPTAETSGIVDVSRWFGRGWWALDVQSHIDLPGSVPGLIYDGPGPQNGTTYTARREDGQLLLMHVPGS